ncbi:MAG: polyheme membrane-associated cytochrome C, partial [Anaerolineaceae bacterium]|nr:polyheme membrane-associated cytochrome C [Anaerolineaceae bacterium]
YNFQVVAKDPGAFAHNGTYVLQFLYDSIEALGGDVTAMTRP